MLGLSVVTPFVTTISPQMAGMLLQQDPMCLKTKFANAWVSSTTDLLVVPTVAISDPREDMILAQPHDVGL